MNVIRLSELVDDGFGFGLENSANTDFHLDVALAYLVFEMDSLHNHLLKFIWIETSASVCVCKK